MTHRPPSAWLVVSGDGRHRAVFLDQARAAQWAPSCHGTTHPLYLWPSPVPIDAPVLVQPGWDRAPTATPKTTTNGEMCP